MFWHLKYLMKVNPEKRFAHNKMLKFKKEGIAIYTVFKLYPLFLLITQNA